MHSSVGELIWYLDCYCYDSEHMRYIDQFCEDFQSTLKKMITDGITKRKNTEVTEALHLECVQHVQFAQERCKLFRGRKIILEEIQKKVTKSRFVYF